MRPVSVLLLVFVVLKLTDNVAWSWLWVLAPVWIPAALWMAVTTFAAILEIIGHAIQRRARRKAGLP